MHTITGVLWGKFLSLYIHSVFLWALVCMNRSDKLHSCIVMASFQHWCNSVLHLTTKITVVLLSSRLTKVNVHFHLFAWCYSVQRRLTSLSASSEQLSRPPQARSRLFVKRPCQIQITYCVLQYQIPKHTVLDSNGTQFSGAVLCLPFLQCSIGQLEVKCTWLALNENVQLHLFIILQCRFVHQHAGCDSFMLLHKN